MKRFLKMEAYAGRPACLLKWSPNPEPETRIQSYYKPCSLPSEDIWTEVQLWCASRGIPVPPEDEEACMKMIAEEKATIQAIPEMLEKARAEPSTEKPSFGSPEYWKAYWAKKRESGWVPKKEKK